MGVSQIMQAVYGTYIPTGVYSFEFRKKHGGETITEIPLMLPPESTSVTEPQRSELIPTIGGGYLCDFGNDFKDISISGSIHFFYVGSEKNPLAFRMDESKQQEAIDGYTEFLKLRFMISRYRDYTLTRKAKLIAPAFSSPAIVNVKALRDYVAKQKKALASDIEVIYHDYDDDNHFKVKVDQFSITRDKSDPFTVKYSISLKAYEVDSRTASSSISTTVEFKKVTVEEIISLNEFMLTLHPMSLPTEVPSFTGNDTIVPTPLPYSVPDYSEEINKDIQIYNLNERLRIVRSYFAWAVGMVQAGVMSVETAMAGFNNYTQASNFRNKMMQ